MNTYQINVQNLDDTCSEINISHLDWQDLQVEIEAKHLLLSKDGCFLATGEGLVPVVTYEDLWETIPRVDRGLPVGDPIICLSDYQEAELIVKTLAKKIIEVCPSWGTPIPERRVSARK